jgi:hypothetical protein
MLANAIAGGVLGATYLVVLVLQLNPHVPIASMTVVRWFVTLVAFYGLYLSVAVYLILLVREVLASRPLYPAWLSVRLLAWLSAACAAGAAWISWGNLRGFHAVLGESAAERMRQGATATTILAAVLVSVVVLRYSFGRRGTGATAALLVASIGLSVGVPLWVRGPGDLPVPAARRHDRPQPASELTPHVRLLLLDGAALNFIRDRVAGGQLPNFGTLLDRGATMFLATLKPTQAETVWAAAATGKYPPKNGVRSAAIYKVRPDDTDPVDLLPDNCFASALAYQGFIREEKLTSASLRARPFWDILADYGLASGIVAWPLTNPAHADRGYIISDYFDDAASSPLRTADQAAGYPTTAVDIARAAFDEWQVKTWPEVMPTASPSEPPPDGWKDARWDRAYGAAALQLEQQFAPRLTALRYQALDVFAHPGLRAARPDLFGELNRDSSGRSILDRYYTYLDGEIGAAMGALSPGDVLFVVSGFGMEPETIAKRILARVMGWPERSGTHESAPDGFLIAYGSNVARGPLPRGAIVDLAPTVLYAMGLPVGRDMDGFARADLFLRSYTLDHPIAFISTHERGPRTEDVLESPRSLTQSGETAKR